MRVDRAGGIPTSRGCVPETTCGTGLRQCRRTGRSAADTNRRAGHAPSAVRNAERPTANRLRTATWAQRTLRALCLGSTLWLCAWIATASAQHMGLVVRDAAAPAGAEVTAVTPGAPASRAGLQAGDVIVKVQGTPIANADQFTRAAHATPAGATVILRISRQGWEKDVSLASPPAALGFGINVRDASPGPGVEIASVPPDGPALAAGVAEGDRVVRLDGRAISNARELQALLEDAARRAKPVTLTIERKGWGREVTLTPKAVLPATAEVVRVESPTRTGGDASAGTALSVAMDEANRQYDARNWRDAEASYRKLLEVSPDDPRIAGRLCHVLVMQERFETAVEACRRAAQLAPRESGPQQNIAYSFSRLGRYGDAIAAYQKAIELTPDWPEPYFGIAAAYSATRNWARAAEYYRMVVDRDSRNAAAWQALGDALGEQGRTDDAITSYRRALQVGAAGAELHRGLGWQLYRAGRLPDAERALLEANRLNPRDANTLVMLGLVADKLGKVAEATQAWQRAAELDPAGAEGTLARQNLAALAAQAPRMTPGMPPVDRGGAAAETTLRGATAVVPTGSPSPPVAGSSAARPGPPTGAQPLERLKATIAVGDFQAKAANVSSYIGDGLREMLVTALYGNGNFVVLERMDMKGLAAEQALSRSRMARTGEALPEGQMDVAEIMVYGAVTEFEPEVRGGGVNIAMGNVPLSLGLQSKAAHMAIDMRVVDVASGRVLATGRVTGEARSAQASVGTTIAARGTQFPVTLGGFQNTPMEQAIRECIDKATGYVVANTPPRYFRHQ
jgi:curli biogenesis system outer membrane secretion channel CsgG/Flp pilus assembly protein TadD